MRSRPKSMHSPQPPIGCPHPIELAAFCDGTLEQERAGAVALHVAECSMCGAILTGGAAWELEDDRSNALHPASVEERALVERVARRAQALMAPESLPFTVSAAARSSPAAGRRSRSAWNAIAAAASLAAAVVGWQVAPLLAGRATVAPGDFVARSVTGNIDADESMQVAGTVGQESNRAVSTDDSMDIAAVLVTFGLFEELDAFEFFGSGESRSES
ncbi:MAG: hypothetical protein KF724_08630 [Phycisphaeraceae bacterium]|nr:hypothetical protein [Phycisphaeraceae bacterium]